MFTSKINTKQIAAYLTLFTAFFLIPAVTYASEGAAEGGGHVSPVIFLYLGIILLAAKLGGVVEKIGMPSVLGELMAGIALSAFGFAGLAIVDDIRHNDIVAFFAQFGAVILLFQVGLESNIKQMLKVGTRATLVAIAGVAVPFILGTYIIGPVFFPEADFTSHLFIGASIVATSVGITASVFKTLNISKTQIAQTVIGAAVIDDILGLIILAVVSSLVAGNEITLMTIVSLSTKSFLFLAFAVAIGNMFAKDISRLFSKIHTGTGMKLGLVLIIALVYSYVATLYGLEPIVGAFAAGLVLDPVHFKFFKLPAVAYNLNKLKGKDKREEADIEYLCHQLEHTHVEDMVNSIALVFVPFFFAYTGMQIDIASLLNPGLYVTAIIISILAILGKLVAGIAAEGNMYEKMLAGMSMVPRGEVGLIFLSVGKSLNAIDSTLFSVLLLTIVITTFIAPIGIKMIVPKTGLTQTASNPV